MIMIQWTCRFWEAVCYPWLTMVIRRVLKVNEKKEKKNNCGIFQNLQCSQERGFCIDPKGSGVALQNFRQQTKRHKSMLVETWSIHNKTAEAVGTISRHFVIEAPQEEKTNLKHINCKKVAALYLNIEKKSQKSFLNLQKDCGCLKNL